jgi:hypothetical protein
MVAAPHELELQAQLELARDVQSSLLPHDEFALQERIDQIGKQ